MMRPIGYCFLVLLAACGGDRAVSVPLGPDPASAPPAFVPAPPPHAPVPLRGPPYPVVFVHGMAGFDALRVGGLSMDYFGSTVQDLTARGEEVFRVVLPPFDSSEVRAAELARQLDDVLRRTQAAKVNLIAHSQGGLDARVLISPAGLGWGDRVQTLVTVSTPHHGTKVANVAVGVERGLPDSVSRDVLEGIAGLLSRTVYEVERDPNLRAQVEGLSEPYLENVFNPKYRDDPRVRYLSWAGRSNLRAGLGVCDDGTYANQPWKVDVLLPLFSGLAVATEWGLPAKVSDGLVTVESAKWGTFQGCIPADHLDEVGMPNANGVDLSIFDSQQFFRDVVAELRAHGD
jgi:triacylglycerol lipase